MKKYFVVLVCLCLSFFAFGQESLKSYEEDYYLMLSLTGEAKRNYLSYRTLSDSIWTVDSSSDVPWQDRNLGTVFTFTPETSVHNWFVDGIDRSFKLKVFGPDWYNSYNTAAPFGQNDGALWQGRGYNSSLTGGVMLKAYGFEMTLKPQLCFSQNLEFELVSTTKTQNGSEYWYWWGDCDAPQRFGDDAFWTFDWGDSDIRYNFYTFTVGFGTQAVWLGPARQNALLLSNNAPTFPKLDIGLNRTSLYLPFLNWYLGDIEMHSWVGKLTESDYFDDDESNDHNQYSGFTFSWSVPHIKGLTFGFNKVCMCKWGDAYWLYYLNPFFVGNVFGKWVNTSKNINGEDCKASFTMDWLFEKVGFELFAEIGVDDYLANGLKFYEYARYPFHTITYTAGFCKSFVLSSTHNIRGELEAEFDFTEGSRDYYNWPGNTPNFGFHYQITQGYTNRGQWLGSGIGYGGNSQYVSFTVYSPHGYDKIFVGRNNIDNNWVNYQISMGTSDNERASKWYTAYKANFYTGVETLWFIPAGFSVKAGALYDLIINPCYESDNYWNNFQFSLDFKWTL